MFNFLSAYSKKQIFGTLTLIIIMIAIPISVFVVQKTQILKSKASNSTISNALDILGSDGKQLSCDQSKPDSDLNCNISNPNITIRIRNLDALTK